MFSPCLVLRNIHNDSVYIFASSMGDRGSTGLFLTSVLIWLATPFRLFFCLRLFVTWFFVPSDWINPFPTLPHTFLYEVSVMPSRGKANILQVHISESGTGRGGLRGAGQVHGHWKATGSCGGGGLPKRALAPVQLEGSLRSCRYSPLTPPFSNIPFPEHVFVDFRPINTV